MKPINVKSGSYAECSVDSNAKFKIGDHICFLSNYLIYIIQTNKITTHVLNTHTHAHF